jgi:hypothetical protein
MPSDPRYFGTLYRDNQNSAIGGRCIFEFETSHARDLWMWRPTGPGWNKALIEKSDLEDGEPITLRR